MTKEEAIKELRSFLGQLTEGCQEAIKVLIPELKESEDERIRKEIISALKFANDGGVYDKHIAYLEKQKAAEWSKEDKHRCKDAIYFLKTAKKHYADTSEIELTIAWLKSLRPQPKNEWSEEDEKDTAHIIRILDDCYAYGKHDLSKTDHENLVNKLKFLKERMKGE